MSRAAMGIAFFSSIFLMPWWAVFFLGILFLALFQAYALVVMGGVLMDLLFGIPEPAVFGFSYLYTLVFALLALLAWFLEKSMLE